MQKDVIDQYHPRAMQGEILIGWNRESFLLYIHPDQRGRAKNISSGEWKSSWKCWVYPHGDSRTREALKNEFESDWVQVGEIPLNSESPEQRSAPSSPPERSRPDYNRPPPFQRDVQKREYKPELRDVGTQNRGDEQLPRLRSEVQRLKDEIQGKDAEIRERETRLSELDRAVRLLQGENESKQEQIRNLEERESKQRATVQSREIELQTSIQEVAQLSEENRSLTRKLRLLSNQNAQLKRQATENTKDPYTIVGEHCLDEIATCPGFENVANEWLIAPQLPILISQTIEQHLRKYDQRFFENRHTLHELIKLCHERRVIDDDGADMAHIVRKHRNYVTHDLRWSRETPEIKMARAMITLFAASILVSRLPATTDDLNILNIGSASR